MGSEPTAPFSGRWRESAACAGMGPDAFFPSSEMDYGSEGAVREAKAVCTQCPVRLHCLAEALRFSSLHGIWGGLTASERRALKQRRGRAYQITPLTSVGIGC